MRYASRLHQAGIAVTSDAPTSIRDRFGAQARPNILARAARDAGDTLAYAFDRDIRAGFWDSTLDSFKMIPAYLGFYLLSEQLVAKAVVTRPFSRFVKARVISEEKVPDGEGGERIERKIVEPGNEHTVRSVINVFGWFAAVYSVKIIGRLTGGAQEKKHRFAEDFLALAANHAACLRDDLDVAEHVFIQSGGRFQDLLHTIAEQSAPVRAALSKLEATFPDMAGMIHAGRLKELEAIPNLPQEQAEALKRFTEASAHLSHTLGEHLLPEDMARLNLMASAALETRLAAPSRRTYLGPVQPHTVTGFFQRLADQPPAGATDVQAALATLHTALQKDMNVAFPSDAGKTLTLTLDKKARGHIAAALFEFARKQHLMQPVTNGVDAGDGQNPYDDRIHYDKTRQGADGGLDALRDIARAGTGALLDELTVAARHTLRRDLSEPETMALLKAVEKAVHPLLERPGAAAMRQHAPSQLSV